VFESGKLGICWNKGKGFGLVRTWLSGKSGIHEIHENGRLREFFDARKPEIGQVCSRCLTAFTYPTQQQIRYLKKSNIMTLTKNATMLKYFLPVLFGSLLFAGCKKDKDPDPQDEVALMIDEVRAATAAYKDINTAIQAGWSVDLSGCVEHPVEGGMGHHYARMEYIDGRVNHLEPQVLLYMLNAQGEMEFLGVEYIVPFAILPETEPAPELFGQKFHKNPHLELWALHVWTERDNPKGIFEDWNPTVTCEFWVNMLVNEVRTETAAYHDINAAISAGWDNDLSGCVDHPTEGGMGHHYARMAFMDGRVNHLEPQVLLYVPDSNGVMEFLGVEYIVPYAIRPETEEPPMLFGQHFHKNATLEIWALHVWTEKANPKGMFYDWNPDVSCD
jgi:hypothetical protein